MADKYDFFHANTNVRIPDVRVNKAIARKMRNPANGPNMTNALNMNTNTAHNYNKIKY
jgi:hypothetical protein